MPGAYAMCGTDVSYAATSLRTAYAIPGTDILYAATRLSTVLRRHQVRYPPTRCLVLGKRMLLFGYAMSGTDLAVWCYAVSGTDLARMRLYQGSQHRLCPYYPPYALRHTTLPIILRASYAMSGTDLEDARCVVLPYAMSGTDMAFAATRCPET
eukprot:1397516-Rhodomonas_salina.2